MSDDPEVSMKIGATMKFALDRTITTGPMTGALFNMYYNKERIDKLLKRFAFTPKVIGWWLDKDDMSFWITEASRQTPNHFRDGRSR